MTSKILVVALVGAGCVGAAGVGAYMAVRSSVAAPPAVAAAMPATPSAAPSGQAEALETLAPRLAPPDPVPVPSVSVKSPAAAPRAAIRTPQPVPPATSPSISATLPNAPPASTPEPEQAPEAPAATTESTPSTPPEPAFEERTIAAASVIGIRMDTAISSETARVEDRVSARVTRDVKVDGHTVIPAGARLDGTVTMVDRGGKIRDRARIGVRFDTLVVGDTDKVGIQTETIFRDGESPSNEASSKIGASAVVGSILGAVLGGRKAAAIGGAAGAAGGTAAVMAGGRNAATIPYGTPLTVRLTSAVRVLVPHGE
jgi:hypothetical protein